MHDLLAFFKAVGAVLVGVLALMALALVVIVSVSNPWVVVVVLVAVGVLAVLGFVYVVHVLVDLIDTRRHHFRLRRLEAEARADEIEGQREERLRLQRADAEQFRLQWQAQTALPLRRGEVLMVRNGQGFELAYEPPARLPEPVYVESDLDRDDDPAPSPLPDALEAIRAGLPSGDDLLLGFNPDMQPVIRPWKKVKAILILGLQGGGKTSTALWLLLQVVLKGGRLGLIDKHARSEEDSMYSRLRVLRAAFDVPVGDSPQAALRVIAQARRVLQARLDGAHLDYPFLLVVDEFTAIMRQSKTGEPWSEVAQKLAGLVEDYNTEGRKHRCFAVCIGQAANASRSGGTEVRDLFNTRLAHRMRAKQAQMLSLTEYQHEIAHLSTGQALVDMESDEPFLIRIPYVTDEALEVVAARLEQAQVPTSSLHVSRQLVQSQPFNPRSTPVQSQPLQAQPERALNPRSAFTERLQERKERVLELHALNAGKQATIQEIWQVKKGGSTGYKQACEEYDRIIRQLVAEGKLEPQA